MDLPVVRYILLAGCAPAVSFNLIESLPNFYSQIYS